MSHRKPHRIGERPTRLAEYLTVKRIKLELTQQEIGERIKKSRSSICRIERGDRQRECLRGSVLFDLAKAYNAPIEEVLEQADWPQLFLVDVNQKEKKQLASYIKKNL